MEAILKRPAFDDHWVAMGNDRHFSPVLRFDVLNSVGVL